MTSEERESWKREADLLNHYRGEFGKLAARCADRCDKPGRVFWEETCEVLDKREQEIRRKLRTSGA